MSDAVPPKRIFPTSKVDAQAASHVPSTPQTESAAYSLAFQDTEFLLREDLRPVRFQLELLKPELLLNEANIGSTFVFYGSARIPSRDMADALVAAATNPEQEAVAQRLKAKSKYYDVAYGLAKLASNCGCDEEGK
ncbi:MAG: lysine decarboxylase, partial [Sphingomicrobium sp.]